MNGVRIPTLRTLARYGLSMKDYERIMRRQKWACAVCGNVPPSGILHIDHEHIRGWKRMSPDQRKKFVRGVCCWFCNSVILRRGATPTKLRNAAKYLERYEKGRDSDP